MKNLKPSQLPEGAVIDDEKQGEYIKRADGIWEELDSDYMGDRERVSDEGYEKYSDMPSGSNLSWCDKSDDYFTDYRIIATAPGFYFNAGKLHGELIDAIGGYADGSRPHNCKGFNCDA